MKTSVMPWLHHGPHRMRAAAEEYMGMMIAWTGGLMIPQLHLWEGGREGARRAGGRGGEEEDDGPDGPGGPTNSHQPHSLQDHCHGVVIRQNVNVQ